MKSFSFVYLALALLSIACGTGNTSQISPAANAVPEQKVVSPLFQASALTGKGPKDVEKILVKLSESWTPRSGDDDLMQAYDLGQDTTVEFHKGRITSLVTFFYEKDIDPEKAKRLVGLDPRKPSPPGIRNVTTGDNWIKIIY